MSKKLKVWNGRDWNCSGGSLYVCAYSQKDAVDLANQAYRKIRGLENQMDVTPTTLSELRTYWSDCWGNAMNGITPERGVWWTPQEYGTKSKPIRRII